MWIQQPGEINEHLIILGTIQNMIYLVKGERYMLIGGGALWMVHEFEKQVNEAGLDMDRIQYLVIGHTHYDHCTAVPYIQKRYPHIKVLASHAAEKLFDRENTVRHIRAFTRYVMEYLGLPNELEGVSLDFDDIHITQTLREGDRVDLGSGLGFEVYETPGHSRCSITLYEPRQNWLFPSDSLAWPFPGRHVGEYAPTVFDGFEVYLNSLNKLIPLKTRLCGWEHYGAFTDEEAEDIVTSVIRYTLAEGFELRESQSTYK
ncbi:MBL fold metallo-hydrolase, partial [Thermodesulfobacteriota bacterium]